MRSTSGLHANRIAAGETPALQWGVPASSPKPQLEPVPRKPRSVYTLEATGLLVIALLVLVVYVVRYWHHIPWSAR